MDEGKGDRKNMHSHVHTLPVKRMGVRRDDLAVKSRYGSCKGPIFRTFCNPGSRSINASGHYDACTHAQKVYT